MNKCPRLMGCAAMLICVIQCFRKVVCMPFQCMCLLMTNQSVDCATAWISGTNIHTINLSSYLVLFIFCIYIILSLRSYCFGNYLTAHLQYLHTTASPGWESGVNITLWYIQSCLTMEQSTCTTAPDAHPMLNNNNTQ